MKRIVYLFFTAVLLTSCLGEFLTPEPLNIITNENYWKSETDARAALNASYAHLQAAYKNGFLYWAEARSDNFLGSSTGSYPYQGVCYNNITASYPCCNWNNWYKMISVANYGIHFIPNIENITEQKRNHLLGEAYFLRAYAYFHLYRIWGDVPLIKEPVLKAADVTKPSRVAKAEVMQLIVADLDTASVLVDESQQDLYRFSAGALYALQTDVAMWNHNFEKAIDYSERLINLHQYSLVGTNFNEICNPANTTDNIFTMAWSYAANGDNTILTSLNNSANLLIPTRAIYSKWTEWETEAGATDLRRLATIDSARITSYGTRHALRFPTAVVRAWKWSPGEFLQPTDYRDMPLPLYRYADVLLMRAEALNQVGQMSEAIEVMNEVRARAGLPGKTLAQYANKEALEKDLLQERQFELFSEGKRWWDLVRTGHAVEVMNDHFQNYITTYGGSGFNLFQDDQPWQLLWPVHRDIINENGNITQTGEY